MAFTFNGILKFNVAGAEAALTRTKNRFENLRTTIKNTGQALNRVGQGAGAAGAALAPLTLGVAAGTKVAADFEEQLSIVQSVLLASKDEMKDLNDITKVLGATTAFTAKQAGEGAEFLARAGFTSEQIVAALPGVLDAAAASGVSLADAADIVAGQLGAFGRPASDAARVADALSLTTALTNTNMIQLGEAMKFAAPIAKQASLSLEETASAMGVLANAGVKGSLAGTALKNALLQLSKPSKEAIKLFGGKKGFSESLFTVENGVKKLLPVEAIMANVARAVQGAKDPLEATKQAAEIFGLRGATAFSSFASKLQKTTKISDKNFAQLQKGATIIGEEFNFKKGDTIPSLVALRLQIAGAEGTARKMSEIRLDNLKGQFTLFGSAVSGLAIEMGGLVTGPFQRILKVATDFFAVMALGFQQANSGTKLSAAALKSLEKNQFGSLLSTMTEFAQGFIEGFNEIKEAGMETFNAIKSFLEPILGETGLTAKEFGKLAAKIITIGAIAAPVLGAIAAGVLVGIPIVTGLVSAFTAVAGVLSSIVSIVGVVGGAIATVVTFIGFIPAAIIAVAAGIFIFRDEIANAFSSLWDFIVGGAQAAFSRLKDNIISPIASLIKSFVGSIASTSIGRKALQFAGFDTGAIQQIAETPSSPQASLAPEAARTSLENQRLQNESLKQTAIAAPPNEDKLISAIRQGQSSPQGASGQQGPMRLTGELTTRISGRDLNIMVTKAQIENSELNGRSVDPLTKRRSIQNGLAFGGT